MRDGGECMQQMTTGRNRALVAAIRTAVMVGALPRVTGALPCDSWCATRGALFILSRCGEQTAVVGYGG